MTNPTRKLGFTFSFLTILAALWDSTQVTQVFVETAAAKAAFVRESERPPVLEPTAILDPFDPDHRPAESCATAGEASGATQGSAAESASAIRRILYAGPFRFASGTIGLLGPGQERGGVRVLKIGPGEVQVSFGGRQVACTPLAEEPLVRGVLIDRAYRAALVDGRVVPVGSSHEGVLVVAVDLDHVTLQIRQELVNCALSRPTAGPGAS